MVRKGTYSEEYADAAFTTEGSGVCRKANWSFDNNGSMSVSTLGFYGEAIQPEDAVIGITNGKGNLGIGYFSS